MNYLKFTSDKLSVEELTNLVTSPSCGAISVFIGTTRDSFENKLVLKLEYEVYESMGIKALERICKELRRQWMSVENIAIYHRLGSVPIKEASIIIAISSPHREDAIKATEWCIHNVKKVCANLEEGSLCGFQTTMEGKQRVSDPYSPKIKKIKLDFEQKVKNTYVPPYLKQIKVLNADANGRIKKYMKRKRDEIDVSNVREFCCGAREPEFTCARADAVLQKRKDSKSHLEDQTNSDYLTKFIPPNGIEERLQNLECQLSLTTAVPKNIYKRLKSLEDRLLYLESVSPEYIQCWDKTLPAKSVKKKIFSLDEIDDLIAEAQKQIKIV
ncbi:hypothetical protein NQ314_019285 [Rhamnusium bicolor]|uniref:Uncharacterized protein n=1 Tax=Rhamnusium bicolor TaxID=1586634 RepID=A0AAV8WPZ1_9CUCU|nr:hypothetical protein NQ314_019285 [Rhamnusium bicolor]